MIRYIDSFVSLVILVNYFFRLTKNYKIIPQKKGIAFTSKLYIFFILKKKKKVILILN